MSPPAALLRRRSTELFALGVALVCAVELLLVRTAAFATRPEALGLAVTVDLVVGVPALYWLLVVRRGKAPAFSVVGVAVLSWVAARLILPEAGEAWTDRLAHVVPLLEVGLLGLLTWKSRKILRAYRARRDAGSADALEDLRGAFTDVLGGFAGARIAADEVAVWLYGLGGGRRPAGDADSAPTGNAGLTPGREPVRFTVHRRAGWGGIVLALTLATIAEAIVVHWLLSRWSPAAAWVVTALTAYGLLWLFADWRATRLRPATVEDGRLRHRVGLRWTVDVPLALLRAASTLPGGAPAEGALSLSRIPAPNVLLELESPVEVRGPYGIRRASDRLAAYVDEPAALVETLCTRRTEGAGRRS